MRHASAASCVSPFHIVGDCGDGVAAVALAFDACGDAVVSGDHFDDGEVSVFLTDEVLLSTAATMFGFLFCLLGFIHILRVNALRLALVF